MKKILVCIMAWMFVMPAMAETRYCKYGEQTYKEGDEINLCETGGKHPVCGGQCIMKCDGEGYWRKHAECSKKEEPKKKNTVKCRSCADVEGACKKPVKLVNGKCRPTKCPTKADGHKFDSYMVKKDGVIQYWCENDQCKDGTHLKIELGDDGVWYSTGEAECVKDKTRTWCSNPGAGFGGMIKQEVYEIGKIYNWCDKNKAHPGCGDHKYCKLRCESGGKWKYDSPCDEKGNECPGGSIDAYIAHEQCLGKEDKAFDCTKYSADDIPKCLCGACKECPSGTANVNLCKGKGFHSCGLWDTSGNCLCGVCNESGNELKPDICPDGTSEAYHEYKKCEQYANSGGWFECTQFEPNDKTETLMCLCGICHEKSDVFIPGRKRNQTPVVITDPKPGDNYGKVVICPRDDSESNTCITITISTPCSTCGQCPKGWNVVFDWYEQCNGNSERHKKIRALSNEIWELCYSNHSKLGYDKLRAELDKLNPGQCVDENADINRAFAKLNELTADLKVNKWRDAEGKFNTARLVSDTAAGVVLGTAGALITSSLVKKSQVENGFEDLQCTISGQTVAEFGDVFTVGIR